MANTKISALTAAAALAGTEQLPAVQSAATVRTTAQNIADLAPLRGTTTVVAASGATEALAMAAAGADTIYDVTMDVNCTFSFTGAVSGTAYQVMLVLRGAFTPTFPAAVVWPGGSAPTYATPAVYRFLTTDGGTTIYGFLLDGTAEAVAATAGTLALRDASGRTQVADPAVDADAVNRGWANGAYVASANVPVLYLPGVSTEHTSTPDDASLDLSTGLDLRFFGAPDDLTTADNQGLISKAPAGDRTWRMYLSTSGDVVLQLSDDGTNLLTALSTVAVPTADGVDVGIRATWRASDGRVQFSTSTDDGASWTTLGADGTIAIASIFAGTSQVWVGSVDGSNWPYAGTVRRAQARDSIDGTIVADFRGDLGNVGPRYRDSTGKIWTLNGSAYSWTER